MSTPTIHAPTPVQGVLPTDRRRIPDSHLDLVLLGCWTSGLFVVAQHPDEPWMAFVRDLPPLGPARVGLFTTYKLATGSMFAKMRVAVGSRATRIDLELKSRDGHLSDAGRLALERFLGTA